MAELTYAKSPRLTLYPTNEPIFIEKGRLGGESDLVRLARTGKDEVHWLYDHSGRTWYNLLSNVVGSNQNGGRPMNGLKSEIDIPISGKAVTIYHTHTKKSQEKAIGEKVSTLSGLTEFERRVVRSFLLKVEYMHGHFPSDVDIETFVNILDQQEDFNLGFGIASHLGVTSVSLKPHYGAVETGERYERFLNSVFLKLRPQIREGEVAEMIGRAAQKLNRNKIGFKIQFRKMTQ
ncbi:hypothetical protein HYX07_00140 [Candidatus Woesearchaeota archaeon]|nr:hypothetical protein [Candidatus Woesearchaeota archaeon]